MRNGGVARSGKGNGFFSMRTLSGYLRIGSSGASTVASTVRSAAASVASSLADHCEDATRDQVHWAGFDKLECESNILRQVLLLGYRSGFQVWDVEEADDVQMLASSHDGPVSFLQMQKNPIASKKSEDRFSDVRPLLVIASDRFFSGSCSNETCVIRSSPCYGSVGSGWELGNERLLPASIHFYSLRTYDYVHVLKFRSPVYSIRCGPQIVAVLQAAQIHCFNAATLEREYTILTYPIVAGGLSSGAIGYGPLAVGFRWLAYSGRPVAVTKTGRVSPQHLSHCTGLPAALPNGSLVAHYAKESSKQLAAGIVTLGDMGYKKLSKYCSEILPDGITSLEQGNSSLKANGTIDGHLSDIDSIGTVIVRDIVSKAVIVQFRAHRSPISALCFDPSGTLLITASIHGHNINVFRVIPYSNGNSLGSDASGTCVHLYRLQRGITNAVIQDISFSNDSQWIMISSSRGTSHLFAMPPFGGTANLQTSDVNFRNNGYGSDLVAKTSVRQSHSSGSSKLAQQSCFASGPPVTLSVVSRIKNGSNGWKGAVSGAAAAATGRVNPLSGAIASVFHNSKVSNLYPESISSRMKHFLLVFSPSGCIIQYMLRQSIGEDSGIDLSGLSSIPHVTSPKVEAMLVVEALQKWDICHKRNRRDQSDSVDVYGEHGHGESTMLFQKGIRKGTSIYPTDCDTDTKVKLTTEENHHLYISEVELQMHSSKVPLWAKSEYCFQVMMEDSTKTDNGTVVEGEIEVEMIPTCTVEVRSKNLVPVFDHLQSPRFQQSSENTFENNRNGPVLCQKSGVLEDGRHSNRSSFSSIDSMSESTAVAELPNGVEDNGWVGSQASVESNEGFVNNSRDSPGMENQIEFVNNRKGIQMEAQLECVNNKEPEDGDPF